MFQTRFSIQFLFGHENPVKKIRLPVFDRMNWIYRIKTFEFQRVALSFPLSVYFVYSVVFTIKTLSLTNETPSSPKATLTFP